MARKGQSPKATSRSPKDWSQFEFIRINLTEADKAHFKELFAKNDRELFDGLVQMVELGYKMTLTADKTNSCFLCSLTCKDELDDNYGYVMTSRSDDLYEAMLLAAFKHVYLSQDGTWPKDQRGDNWG